MCMYEVTFMFVDVFAQMYCVVPENIHFPPSSRRGFFWFKPLTPLAIPV